MLSTYAGFKGIDFGTVRNPTGPTGKRSTMMNGLADSVTKGADTAVAAYKKKGIDTSAFTTPVDDREQYRTFPFPITNYAADVYALMHPAMQDVFGNGAPASRLDETNDQINLLLDQRPRSEHTARSDIQRPRST